MIFALSTYCSKSYTSDIVLPTMKPFSFVNIRGREHQLQPGGSYTNKEECLAVVQLVQKIAARKVPGWDNSDRYVRKLMSQSGSLTRKKWN